MHAAILSVFIAVFMIQGCGTSTPLEQRDSAAPLRTWFPRYANAFFYRHHAEYKVAAAIHYAHGKAHDDLQQTRLERAYYFDAAFEADYLDRLYHPPLTEPTMMMFGPYSGQAFWKLYRAIDWTHGHHEATYDILAEDRIPWDRKKEWTDRALEAYLNRDPAAARSPAVLELTLRRAGVMMKPYFGAFRKNYPRSNSFFYTAHWWHPVIYEAMMIGGNGPGQDEAVWRTNELTFTQVLNNRPRRMLLSREAMPRYARLSPESANIFDNLHMLHGIAYDILAYEGWTVDQKQAELYRVIRAMAYQPGDEKFSRTFAVPNPDMDPRVYAPWMETPEGAMTAMMEDMFREMWPAMSPDGSTEVPAEVLDQLRKKLAPGHQEGELPGSLLDAVKALVPNIRMEEHASEPGVAPREMIAAMLAGWERKARAIPDIPPLPVAAEPSLPPGPAAAPL